MNTKNISFYIVGGAVRDALLGKEPHDYDIVVANILADVIIPLSAEIAPHMKKGGLFITSGIINSKEKDVVTAIESNPELEIVEITRQNDWVNVTARKV